MLKAELSAAMRRVGWVEPFAKPNVLASIKMGIAALHPPYELVSPAL
jgi:hypothetical protein